MKCDESNSKDLQGSGTPQHGACLGPEGGFQFQARMGLKQLRPLLMTRLRTGMTSLPLKDLTPSGNSEMRPNEGRQEQRMTRIPKHLTGEFPMETPCSLCTGGEAGADPPETLGSVFTLSTLDSLWIS